MRSGKSVVALVALGGALLTLVAYEPALRAGFFFDDQQNVTHASAIHWTTFSFEGIQRVLTEAPATRRPVANLSFALNHLFGGLNPFGYHLVNVLIHLAVGAALGWVAYLLSLEGSTGEEPDRRIAAISASCAAILFLVHPLNTQSVTYVVQRMSALAALFSLLSLGSFLTARRSGAARQRWGFGLSGLFFVLASASKETALALPAVIGLYEVCFHRDSWRSRLGRTSAVSRGLLASGAGLALWATWEALGLFRFWESVGWRETFPGRDYSGYQRVLTESRVLFFYLSLLLWPAPSRLNLEHDFTLSTGFLEPWITPLAIAGWIVIALASAVLARRQPRYGYPLLVFLAFSSIEAGPLNLELVFEHRMYLPMTALAILATIACVDISASRRWLALGAAGLMALPLTAATHARNQLWTDPIAFYRDCAAKSPAKFRPNSVLALELGNAGRFEEAAEVLEVVLRLEPGFAKGHSRAGVASLALGRPEAALDHFREAVRLDPHDPEALFNLAQLLDRRGELETAAPYYRRFLVAPPAALRAQADWVRQRLRAAGLPE